MGNGTVILLLLLLLLIGGALVYSQISIDNEKKELCGDGEISYGSSGRIDLCCFQGNASDQYWCLDIIALNGKYVLR